MATITGKRFQITDGASTPTNLFPYTVSEAVYGLSNTISNAISTALSALSLSTYAGTSAIGSSTQPVYYNGSALVATDLSTTYAPYNANGYLPLTGGTLSKNATSILTLNRTGGNDWVYIAFQSNGTSIGAIGVKSTGVPSFLYSGTENTIWHSGNSNLSTVDWACKTLTASGNVTATGAITAGSASDARLKTNIQSLSAEAAKRIVMALNPVTFTWNEKATELYNQYKGDDLGMIAQEVEPYLPQAVGTIFEKYKRLDYTKVISPLVKVAQDHESRIRQLEAENRELRKEVERLRMN